MAPLLHVHAAGAHHGGLHLPSFNDLDLERGQGAAWHDDQHPIHESIGVASSLQARDDGLLPHSGDWAMVRSDCTASSSQLSIPRSQRHELSPIVAAHLHPPACAPPRG